MTKHDAVLDTGSWLRGVLVWSGYRAELGEIKSWDLKVVQLSDSRQGLSVFRGHMERGNGFGQVVLLDDAYNLHKTISADKKGQSLDAHDFHLLDNGQNAIVLRYLPVQQDLTSKGLEDSFGWVYNSNFKEYELDTGKVLFEWNSIDHVSIKESVVSPKVKLGTAKSFTKPWDYFHINSVDKFENGDYLVSARHTNCIYRISHQDGSIIWRLGGTKSTFTLNGFNFSSQHDARIRKAVDGEEQISLFNNAWNGNVQTRDYSSAMLVELDSISMTASLVNEWLPLEGGLARHQGNVRFLDNGNVFVGWGGIPSFTEFASNGDRVLDVAFSDNTTLNYRTIKQDWVGRPDTQPDLYIYSRSETDPTYFYMSWNGATEVANWEVYGVVDNSLDPVLLGSAKKEGFETRYNTSAKISAGFVKALDHSNNILSTSEIITTIVPPSNLGCQPQHCSAHSQQLQRQSDVVGYIKPAGFMNAKHPAGIPALASDGSQRWGAIVIGAVTLLGVGFWAGRFTRRLKWKVLDLLPANVKYTPLEQRIVV
ncbi:hypothetical protein PVAG01_00072 [Phlyctema vagabunda]|uniref:Arylsulfotransferase n=1 Tax=Phlyctema vagabunda TaxID=108571 RepID=A0ABR4PTN8_9HELO